RPAVVEEDADDRQFAHGKLVLVPASHAASFEGKPLTLTAIEFAILKGFLGRPQHVLGRDAVMANAYQSNIHVSERTVDSHIRNIRAKLAAVGCSDAIATVHGVGFRLGRCGG
ncbi:MAG: winged helix-turn-helix transcriptional regulator, partial [Mesorhizobium sp.]